MCARRGWESPHCLASEQAKQWHPMRRKSWTLQLVAMELHGVQFPEAKLAAFCATNGVARLAVFGSILREDFGPDSDVDILIEFLPGRIPSLFSIAEMEADLSEMLGRRVDLRTPAELSRLFRDRVVAQARVLHAA